MGIAYREGGVTVRLNGALERFARAAAERAAPGALRALEDAVRPVFTQARADWPVKTGTSRAGLEMVSLIDGDKGKARVQIRNDVPYAIYVKPRNLYRSTTAWQAYVRGPMHKLTSALVRELERRIVEEVRRAA